MLYSMVYDEEARRNVVSEAPTYQVKGLDRFVKSLPEGKANHENDNTKQYIFDNDTVRDDCQDNITQRALVFSINTFNYKKMSLQGTYDDFSFNVLIPTFSSANDNVNTLLHDSIAISFL